MSEIVISGYHGFSNSGDEALLWAILNTLRKQKPDITVTVLSRTPKETARVYGVKSVYRYNYFKISREMKNAKMLLFGGGSLLQDVTSSKSLRYYLSIISLAQRHHIKTMLYANGIGPLTKKGDRRVAAKVLNKVDVITLRDDKSDEELKRLNVTKPEIIITADPAFTIDSEDSLSGKYFIKRAGVPEGTKVAVVSLRQWSSASHNFEEIVAELCDKMVKKYNIYPLFVSMQYPADSWISRSIISKMKNRAFFIDSELSVPEMFSVLSGAEVIIGMRLHSLIYATTLGIPAMALVYDPKVSAFMESVSQPVCLDVENLTLEAAEKNLDILITEDNERRKKLNETNKILRRKAEENGAYAINLLKDKGK